jgi:glucan 1,3-beta-glucosidase
MPDDRRRERRYSRDPETDDDRRRRRRPSDAAQRRRRGHRATDSTGELLPKGGQYDSSANSTPRKSRHSTPASGSSQPLNPGGLARLDALNQKQDRKRGWDTHDEAYLQEVRARETGLENERKQKERQKRERVRRERAEDEQPREGEEDDRRRHKHDRRRSERHENRRPRDDVTPQDSPRDPRPTKKRQNTDADHTDAEEFRTHIRLQSDRTKRSPKKDHRSYEKIVDQRHLESKAEASHRKKRRLISGPYLEDGRAEKVYNHRSHKEQQKGFFSRLLCFDLTRRRIMCEFATCCPSPSNSRRHKRCIRRPSPYYCHMCWRRCQQKEQVSNEGFKLIKREAFQRQPQRDIPGQHSSMGQRRIPRPICVVRHRGF